MAKKHVQNQNQAPEVVRLVVPPRPVQHSDGGPLTLKERLKRVSHSLPLRLFTLIVCSSILDVFEKNGTGFVFGYQRSRTDLLIDRSAVQK